MLSPSGDRHVAPPPPTRESHRPTLFEGRLGCSIDETSTALGVQRDTVYRLIAEGRLTMSKLGRRTIVHVASIQRLLDETVIRPKPRVRRHRSGASAVGPDVVPARYTLQRGDPANSHRGSTPECHMGKSQLAFAGLARRAGGAGVRWSSCSGPSVSRDGRPWGVWPQSTRNGSSTKQHQRTGAVPPTVSTFGSSSDPRPSHSTSFAVSTLSLRGLVRWSFIPAARLDSRLPSSAPAVRATIGVVRPWNASS